MIMKFELVTDILRIKSVKKIKIRLLWNSETTYKIF